MFEVGFRVVLNLQLWSIFRGSLILVTQKFFCCFQIKGSCEETRDSGCDFFEPYKGPQRT